MYSEDAKWLKELSSERYEKSQISKWLSTGKTMFCQRDLKKGNAVCSDCGS